MTTFKEQPTRSQEEGSAKLTLAEIFETMMGGDLSIRITAYDGSSAGPEDAQYGLDLKTPRGTTYLVTAPGDLGLARAYISGDLELVGSPSGRPVSGIEGAGLRPQVQQAVAAAAGECGALAGHRTFQADRPAAAGGGAALAAFRRGAAAFQNP